MQPAMPGIPLPAVGPEPLPARRPRASRSLPPPPAILLEGDFPATRLNSPEIADYPDVRSVHAVSASETRTATQAASAQAPGVAGGTPRASSPGTGPAGGAAGSERPAGIEGADAGPRSHPAASAVPRPKGSVWLSPRDAHCLLAYWTLVPRDLEAFSGANGGVGWEWRLRSLSANGPVVASGALPADRDFQFIPVALAGVAHVVEIGFRHADGAWIPLITSSAVATPADRAWGPPATAAASTAARQPTLEACSEGPSTGPSASLPGVVPPAVLEEILWGWNAVPAPGGSSELPSGEATARRLTRPCAPGENCGEDDENVPPGPGTAKSFSSESLAESPDSAGRRFWFRVNAEVVLHGSTEPDALVTIAGRPVPLRKDGSFTFRFALPDGDFQLPAVAICAAGDDMRAAELQFVRQTRTAGHVGMHPVDHALNPPVAEAIAG